MAKNYPNLPGVNINVTDGNLATTTARSANSVLIIANAQTSREVPEGPVYVPSEQDLHERFGGFFYEGRLNPIAAQWSVAYKAGVTNIYLMALKGDSKKEQFVDLYDKLYNTVSDLQVSHIVLDGLFADEEIEGLTEADFKEIQSGQDIALPASYIYAATNHAAEIPADAGTPQVLNIRTQAGEELTLTFAAGEVNAQKVQEDLNEMSQTFSLDLQGQFVKGADETSLVFNQPVELTGPVAELFGFAEEPELTIVGSPASLLANYVEAVSEEIGGVLGYIGTSSPETYDLQGIRNYVNKLLKVNTQISPYLQIVAGPEIGVVVPGSLRRQWVSGITHYAVLVNSLLPQNAPTNQPLLGSNQLRYAFSNRQLNSLVGHKYVTFRVDGNQIRVVDGITTAPDLAIGEDTIMSDFTRLSTVRIVNYMVARLRYALRQFIGSPNEFHNYNGMNTAIRAELDDAIQRGIIQDASYSIRLGSSLDTAEIDLKILPQFELRVIDVTVGLTRPEGLGQTNR